MINFLLKNFFSIIIVFLILLISILSAILERIKKNKIIIKIIVFFVIAVITILIIPPLNEQIQYNLNKPIISIDIHKVDSSFAKSQYNISEDKITYWVGIQNPGDSPQTIKQANLDLYFDGFVIDKGILFENSVGSVNEKDIPFMQIKNNNEFIDYRAHSLVVEGMMPGSAVVEIFAVEPNNSGNHYYRMGQWDLKWTWQLNGQDKIESNTSIIN